MADRCEAMVNGALLDLLKLVQLHQKAVLDIIVKATDCKLSVIFQRFNFLWILWRNAVVYYYTCPYRAMLKLNDFPPTNFEE